jgi:thiamine-monophosphate kinase
MVTRGIRLDEEKAAALRQAHLLPRPRLAEGRLLAAGGVRCAMDISDGLVADLGKVCLASGVAARVHAERVPVHPALRHAFPSDCLALALGGGEDYELVFTAPQAVMEGVLVQLPAGAAAIGEIVEGQPGKVFVVDERGRELPQARGGWDHFQP